MKKFKALAGCVIILLTAIAVSYGQSPKPLITLNSLSPEFNTVVSKNAKAELLANGFLWSEGPLWIESHQMFLFSDVKKNIIYKWTKEKGREVYCHLPATQAAYHVAGSWVRTVCV